jgi:protein SCO1/2
MGCRSSGEKGAVQEGPPQAASAPSAAGYGPVPAFTLTDQNGQRVTADTLRGQTWVAAFMFTRCPTVCPKMMAYLKGAQDEARARRIPLRFVGFSIDPEHDTPPVLLAFAQKYQVDQGTFTLLTGDPKAVQETAERGFKVAVSGKPDASKEHFGLSHGSHVVLVGPDLVIRGYYRSSEPESRSQLLADAALLAR